MWCDVRLQRFTFPKILGKTPEAKFNQESVQVVVYLFFSVNDTDQYVHQTSEQVRQK